MVDNRSAGFFGIGGSFNFKSGDISGTAANTQDDKMGQGTEYFAQGEAEEENYQQNNFFVDRSAQLRATLNSLAMMNVANVLNDRQKITSKRSEDDQDELDEEFVNDFDENNSQEDEPQEQF